MQSGEEIQTTRTVACDRGAIARGQFELMDLDAPFDWNISRHRNWIIEQLCSLAITFVLGVHVIFVFMFLDFPYNVIMGSAFIALAAVNGIFVYVSAVSVDQQDNEIERSRLRLSDNRKHHPSVEPAEPA